MITTQATHSTNPEIKLLQRVHVIIINTIITTISTTIITMIIIITIIITIMIKSLHMIIRGEERGGREFFSQDIIPRNGQLPHVDVSANVFCVEG